MKAILGAIWPYLIAVACVAAVLYWAYHSGYEAADNNWKGAINEANLSAALESAASEREQRKIESGRVRVVEQQQAEAEARAAVDNSTAADLAGDVARLLEQARSYGSPGGAVRSDSGASASCEGPRRAAMVLSDLLGRSVETNQELASEYDKLRTAALACQNTFNGIQKGK